MGTKLAKSPKNLTYEGFGNSDTYVAPTKEEKRAEAVSRCKEKQPKAWRWNGDQWSTRMANFDAKEEVEKTLSSPDKSSLKVVTYNVWFDTHRFTDRLEALMKLLSEADADVIALQEVTMPWLDGILKESWVRESYTISDATGNTLSRYGVLLLVRESNVVSIRHHDDNAFVLHDLDSLMDRHLLTAKLHVHGEPFLIGTVHLESLNSTAVRRAQLETVFPILNRTCDNSMLVGDFNFSDGWDENQYLDAQYCDLWTSLVPSGAGADPGYTMPSDGHYDAWRPDHALLRAARDRFKPEKIQIIGKEPCRGGSAACTECHNKGRVCTPSDHFGLVATISVSDSEMLPPTTAAVSALEGGAHELVRPCATAAP